MRSVLMLLCLSLPATAVQDQTILGPPVQTAIVDDLTEDSSAAWTARSGGNVALTLRFGWHAPGVVDNALLVSIDKVDPDLHDAPANWLLLERDLRGVDWPEEVSGIRFSLGSPDPGHWWIQAALLLDDETTYTAQIADGALPAGHLARYSLPLEWFRSDDGRPLGRDQLTRAAQFRLVSNTPGETVYLDRISTYVERRLASWIDFYTSDSGRNLFEPGEPVELALAPGGLPPADATAIDWTVSDYWGEVVAEGRFELTGAAPYLLHPDISDPGYYEVTARFAGQPATGASGSDLRAEGSVPPGIGTFAVLPRTVEQNLQTFARVGQNAFFGLHGDFHGLADAMGLPWGMGYAHWRYAEPTRPDRETGTAPWAAELLAQEPEPPYRFHFTPFGLNIGDNVPEWARGDLSEPPAVVDWADAEGWVRDHVLVERHRYPHMSPRLYGGAWEVNLNMPPHNVHRPPFEPTDVAELYRRVRQVVLAEDPDGQVIGPCPSHLDLEWLESVFEAGVLEYLDGIEIHAYNEASYTPEENRLPEKLAALRELVRRHTARDLPIYVTERGDVGAMGTEATERAQARHMVRAAIILKGEGVRAYWPFYGIDYDESAYGFCFNLEIDAESGPWSTKRISPKPLVPAMATCAWMLEGTSPAGRLTDLPEGVWAYRFERPEGSVLAAWTVGAPVSVALRADEGASAVDFMGRIAPLEVASGQARLHVTQEPLYIVSP